MSTKIEWCEESWNPITGCSPVSEGCEHCYAKRMAQRLKGRHGYPEDDPFRVTFHPDRLKQPFTWKKPRHIFVVSMGDLFHNDVDPVWIFRVFNIIGSCSLQKHIFLLLTKRPETMKAAIEAYCKIVREFRQNSNMNPDFEFYDNVWLGVTAENQQRADECLPILLQIPAAKHFVSIEPMLGPVDLHIRDTQADIIWRRTHGGSYQREFLDWVILGGESGPGARPMHPDWARSVRDQCQEARVPFFFKQWGEWKPCESYGEAVYSTGRKHCDSKSTDDLTDWSFIMNKVGKKAAGRLLEGQEWNERPT